LCIQDVFTMAFKYIYTHKSWLDGLTRFNLILYREVKTRGGLKTGNESRGRYMYIYIADFVRKKNENKSRIYNNCILFLTWS